MAAPSTAASSYAAKLLDPRWQRKRLEALESADWACEACGDAESTLHVHHKQYIKGRNPWEYEGDQLAVLCKSCHQAWHGAEDDLLDVISRLPIDSGHKWLNRERAAALIAGAMGLEGYGLRSDELRAWFFVGLDVQRLVDLELAASGEAGHA